LFTTGGKTIVKRAQAGEIRRSVGAAENVDDITLTTDASASKSLPLWVVTI
jgi:hypothetical protein